MNNDRIKHLQATREGAPPERGKQTCPTAKIPVIEPKRTMEVIFRKEIERAEGKERALEQEVGEYRGKCANPNTQAE